MWCFKIKWIKLIHWDRIRSGINNYLNNVTSKMAVSWTIHCVMFEISLCHSLHLQIVSFSQECPIRNSFWQEHCSICVETRDGQHIHRRTLQSCRTGTHTQMYLVQRSALHGLSRTNQQMCGDALEQCNEGINSFDAVHK